MNRSISLQAPFLKMLIVSIAVALFFACGITTLQAKGGNVVYTPSIKLVEGDIPYTYSYTLAIKSPADLATTCVINFSTVVNSVPAGSNSSTAMGYVTYSPTQLTYSAPLQEQNVTVTVSIPASAVSGSYGYQVYAMGWPSGLTSTNTGASINMTASLPGAPLPPSVAIASPLDRQTYTYTAGGSAVLIPLQFQSTATANAPITNVDADLNGVAISPLTSTGLNTGSVSTSGTISISAPGTYTVRARATNIAGSSSTTVEIIVTIMGAPPSVTIAQPVANSSFVYSAGGASLNVPFSFTGRSSYGTISALSASLNGVPVSVAATGLGSALATGSGTLTINAGGTYVLAVTATDAFGTASTSTSFTVTVQSPPPVVTITSPANGTVFSRVAGSPATTVPFTYLASTQTGYAINSIRVTLGSTVIGSTTAGLGTASVSGSGNLSVTTAGTYVVTVTAASGGVTAASSVTITVKETQPPPPVSTCKVLWLPPISLGKVWQGGACLPIKFMIQCSKCSADDDDDDDRRHGCHNDDDYREYNGHHYGIHDRDCKDHEDHRGDVVRDRTVKIAIYEIYANGTTSAPQIFNYGSDCNPNPPTYAIDRSFKYQLNFPTASGVHRYHIDVCRFASGSTVPEIIGTKEFTTK